MSAMTCRYPMASKGLALGGTPLASKLRPHPPNRLETSAERARLFVLYSSSRGGFSPIRRKLNPWIGWRGRSSRCCDNGLPVSRRTSRARMIFGLSRSAIRDAAAGSSRFNNR